MAERRKLGEMLVDAGLIDEIQLQSALGHQAQWGMRLGAALIDMKFITEETLCLFLEQQLNTKCVDILSLEIAPEALKLVTADMARDFGVFPVKADEKAVLLATADPMDLPTLDNLAIKLKRRVVPCLALESEIRKAILLHYEGINPGEPAPEPSMHNVRVLDHTQMMPEEKKDAASQPSVSEWKEVTTQHLVEAIMRALEKKGILSRSEIFEELE